jgi:signal transduction histidine kinase
VTYQTLLGEVIAGAERIIGPLDQPTYLRVSAAPMRRPSGAIDGSIVIFSDITSQRRAQDERTRLREQFIGILGHDLRNPLAAILASTQILSRDGNLNEAQTHAVTRIDNSARKIDRMISDILDFTRGRLGGGFVLKPRPINIHELCHSAVDELRVGHPERDFEVFFEGDGRAYGDPDRLAQVVSNLVRNAVYHGSRHTQVRVRSRSSRGEAVIEVGNRGKPIPLQVLPVLFEPFSRTGEGADSTGVGLGLYIVKQIVDAHHGKISVRSTEADGTTFTVWLPAGSGTLH